MKSFLPKNRDYRQSDYWYPKKTPKRVGDLVTCPIRACDGGIVKDFITGNERLCLFCKGSGMVTKELSPPNPVTKNGKRVGRPYGEAKKPKRCICGDTGVIRDAKTRKERPCVGCKKNLPIAQIKIS